MSPEQVRGEPADHRADIFAFGCVLYEMLSGTRAFRRGTPVESMNAVLNEALPELSTTHPTIPLPLARIVERCLEKQPDDRFQSAKDLAFALSALAVGSSAARSTTGEPVAGRSAVKRFALPALAAVLAVSLAVVSVAWWRTTRTPGRASQIRSLAVLPFAFETQDPKLAGLGKIVGLDK
jgi:serine/threonine protein kinase